MGILVNLLILHYNTEPALSQNVEFKLMCEGFLLNSLSLDNLKC